MKDEKKKLTTNAGAPVPDNQNVLTAGPRGPMLLQDVWFLEKLAHFDREVIPERRSACDCLYWGNRKMERQNNRRSQRTHRVGPRGVQWAAG